MSDILLEAIGIRKVFKKGGQEVWALGGVDLVLHEGERVAIVGPSGAGKSTLLQILGTLERPTSGFIYYKGQPINSLSDEELSKLRNREIGFVFQFHHLLQDFTALENVMIPCLIYGYSIERAKEAAREILERVGLGHRLHHRPSELSGGEQQRVAIARALVMRPKLLLADEPTGNLDSQTGQELMGLLERFNERFGLTLLVVTHNEAVARRFPKALKMKDGKIVGKDG